jgi:hypothetical protein
MKLGRFAVGSQDLIPPNETPTVSERAHQDYGLSLWRHFDCCRSQELPAYKELLELIRGKGVALSAVLPDESGPAVALPGVCRLNRVEGYGDKPQQNLLLIGT